MSRNFELMQRAGKLLEIELPRSADPASPIPNPSIALPLTPTLAPTFPDTLTSPSTDKWEVQRAGARSTVEQIALEESHRLVQHIFSAHNQDPPRVVVFAGIDHGNGCSRICVHTVEALQENLRGTICLVEANFRSPTLHQVFGTSNHYGLTDALLGEGPMKTFATPVRKANLYLMSCGSLVVNSHGLLNSERLGSRFDDLRNEFDSVVVDAPPLSRYSDAIALGRAADGLVLVLEANATRREAALRISEHLRASQIRILGAVLNKRTFPIPESLYRLI
jgi:Mrp family chromosome partitioning ATPase